MSILVSFSNAFRLRRQRSRTVRGGLCIGTALFVLLSGCGGGEEPAADEHAGHDHGVLATPAADAKAAAVLANSGKQLYTCGMHPQIISEEPGTCPICGMELTPIKQTASSEGVVAIDPVTVQNIGVRTAPVTVEALGHRVRTTGRFEMDERGAYTVSLKVGGWVEKLYADYEGAIVREGQPLLELYSPELVSTQEEYLLALRNARRMQDTPAADDAQRLLDAARRRLAYWDLTDEQIGDLEASGRPQRTLTFYAAASGEVMNKRVQAGQQVNAGQALMDILDLSKIWLIADIYEQDLGWVKEGTPVRIELPYVPGKTMAGRVEHIYHMLDAQARTARARIVLPGSHEDMLKPGMYATVYLEGEVSDPAPVVPEEAVIRSGEQAWVIVALGGGRFQPREVHAGTQVEGKTQILHGVEAGELVVTSAQFLIDSEARLKSAIGTLAGGHNHGAMSGSQDAGLMPAGREGGMMGDAASVKDVKDMLVDVYAADANGDGTVFLCTDKPHLMQDRFAEIPGCTGAVRRMSVGAAQSVLFDMGYTDVPVDPARADTNADGYVYQSPMHWAVIKDGPGNCDLCNMTLERRTVEEARQALRREGYVVR